MGDTRDLLAKYTELINRHGPNSVEAASYLDTNKMNSEFVELAETARWLKGALTAPRSNGSGSTFTPLPQGN